LYESLSRSPFLDGNSTAVTDELRAEPWRDCLEWTARALDFSTKGWVNTKLSPKQVASLVVFGNPRLSDTTLKAVAVEIPVEEIEAAISRIRRELFPRGRHRARVTVRPVAVL